MASERSGSLIKALAERYHVPFLRGFTQEARTRNSLEILNGKYALKAHHEEFSHSQIVSVTQLQGELEFGAKYKCARISLPHDTLRQTDNGSESKEDLGDNSRAIFILNEPAAELFVKPAFPRFFALATTNRKGYSVQTHSELWSPEILDLRAFTNSVLYFETSGNKYAIKIGQVVNAENV